jgi:hypothetical protein
VLWLISVSLDRCKNAFIKIDITNVDSDTRRMFWTESTSGKIKRADLDGNSGFPA